MMLILWPFQKHVTAALNLDQGEVLGFVEDSIPGRHVADIRTGSHHRGPRQPLADRRGGGDQYAAAALALTVLLLGDKHPVVQELDRQFQRVIRFHTLRATITDTTTPTVRATWSTRTAPYSST